MDTNRFSRTLGGHRRRDAQTDACRMRRLALVANCQRHQMIAGRILGKLAEVRLLDLLGVVFYLFVDQSWGKFGVNHAEVVLR